MLPPISLSDPLMLLSLLTSSQSSTTRLSNFSVWAHLLLLLSDTDRRLRHTLQPKTWMVVCFPETSVWVATSVAVAGVSAGEAEAMVFCLVDTMLGLFTSRLQVAWLQAGYKDRWCRAVRDPPHLPCLCALPLPTWTEVP